MHKDETNYLRHILECLRYKATRSSSTPTSLVRLARRRGEMKRLQNCFSAKREGKFELDLLWLPLRDTVKGYLVLACEREMVLMGQKMRSTAKIYNYFFKTYTWCGNFGNVRKRNRVQHLQDFVGFHPK